MIELPWPIAIVGGGYLGTAVAARIGSPTLVINRSGTWRGDEPVPSAVRMRALDITAPFPSERLAPARALVVCVAPGRQQPRDAVYLRGTEHCLAAIEPLEPARVVYVSSTSAYPDVDGWVDEHDETWPSDERGRVQREAEAMVASRCDALGIPWLVLRLGGLYGPGRDLGRIYRQRDEAAMPGDGHTPTNLIHRDDAVASVLAALRAPAGLRAVIGVCDDEHTTRRRMYDAMAKRLGLPNVAWAEPVTPGTAPRGKRVSNLALKTELGVRLSHPFHRLPEPSPADGRRPSQAGA